jgi:hypothetical protein
MAHSGDALDVPTQGLTATGINTLEQDVGEVKDRNKMAGEEELLPQLIIHTVEKMDAGLCTKADKWRKIPQ